VEGQRRMTSSTVISLEGVAIFFKLSFCVLDEIYRCAGANTGAFSDISYPPDVSAGLLR
jgi:hypothetical protein